MSNIADNDTMTKLVALCKRRGIIFQSSEMYGGINGFWDYGPSGVPLRSVLSSCCFAIFFSSGGLHRYYTIIFYFTQYYSLTNIENLIK